MSEPLTSQEIIDELKARVQILRQSIQEGFHNADYEKTLRHRQSETQTILSWIVGQNQLREEERYREREFELYGNSEQKERTT